MSCFISWLVTILVLIGMVLVIFWEILHGGISLNSVLLLLLENSVSGFWLELMYVHHSKYQVKPHLSPGFSGTYAAAIVHWNPFFHLYQRNKSSASKVKFRKARNHCKKVLQDAKLAYATTTKESITFQKTDSLDFCQIANSILR